MHKYAPVWPGAVYCCFNKNYKVYNIFHMTLHTGLANPTSLQSFMVWYRSVCELRELNSQKKKKEKMKNFGTYGRIGIFSLTPFPCTNLHDFGVNGVF